MNFFFVRDYKRRFCFFSSAPFARLDISLPRTKAIWEKAKQKVISLWPRVLLQEEAFSLAGRDDLQKIKILYSGQVDEKKIRSKFMLYLIRKRTRHIILLTLEMLAIPISGLAAILPGPNILFYILAILVIIHWRALRGIRKLSRKQIEFVSDAGLKVWENAVAAKDAKSCMSILENLEKTHGPADFRRLLWK